MDSTFVEVGDLRFHVAHAGDRDAPMILFLHGFPEYSGAWSEMFERLSDRYFCVAPDQRGFNLSACPMDVGSYVTSALTTDMIGVIDHFRPQGKIRAVVGHDWGAAVAYMLAFRAADRMERLVILNGVHPIPFQHALIEDADQAAASQYIHWLRAPGSEERLAENNFASLASFFAKNMDMDWLHGERLAAYRSAWGAPGTLRGMINWYRASPLAVPKAGETVAPDDVPEFPVAMMQVRVPHLLIWGTGDTALLPVSYAGLGDHCDDLTIEKLPDADHWIAHQKPDQVAEMIAGFVA